MSTEIKSFNVDLSEQRKAKVTFEVTVTLNFDSPVTLRVGEPESLRDITRRSVDELVEFFRKQTIE